MGKLIDLTGQKFGKLTVIGIGERRPVGRRGVMKQYWVCQCECGANKEICGDNLRSGVSQSCGCATREATIERSTKHGFAKRGHKRSRIYSIWASMLGRCERSTDDAYCYYGGRGITVCDEWHDFLTFKDWAMSNGYDKNLTIDRIDVNGNYEPTNCRWVPQCVQNNNTRQNTMITLGRVTHSLADWCRAFNLNYSAVRARRSLGWNDYDALFTPLLFEKKKKEVTA